MDVIQFFKERASQVQEPIVLPEGSDKRIIEAAAMIIEEKLAKPIILGDIDEIKRLATELKVSLNGAKLIDPKNAADKAELVEIFYKIRQHKGISKDEAAELLSDPLYYGTMLVHTNRAAGMVAGSINATGDVLRPAFQIVKTKPGISVVSGAFVMVTPKTEFGDEGVLFFADCAVNPAPNAEELSQIALSTAHTAETLLGMDPKVAMLSFSSKGSAQHANVDKVRKATELAQKCAPNLKIDGELQADAALVAAVSKRKAPNSQVAGNANVLVFPDLEAGNIGYKLVQRFADVDAIGPILQGLAKPINDLSRGCSVEDVVNLVAITSVQAQGLN